VLSVVYDSVSQFPELHTEQVNDVIRKNGKQ